MAKNQGILVEVDGLALEVLEVLEDELTDWISLDDLVQAADSTPSNIINLLSTLSKLTKSLSLRVAGSNKLEIPWEKQKRQFKDVVAELVDNDDEPHFRCIFHKLNGAHVPLAGVYEDVKTEYVPKIEYVDKPVPVEVPVEKIVPVTVGAALTRPTIKPTREKAQNAKQTNDSVFQWSPSPGVPNLLSEDEFVTPSWYAKMKRRVEWGSHIALEGPAGQGKSTAIAQLAAECGQILVSHNCSSGLHQRDLKGFAEISDKTSRFDVAEYATAAIRGWWCQIDEINQADSDALGFMFGQLAPPYKIDLHGKSFSVHENFRLFVTYNLGEIGTKILSVPFKDRFTVIPVSLMTKDELRKRLILNGADDQNLIETMVNLAVNMKLASPDPGQHIAYRYKFQLSPRRLFEAITEVKDGVDLKTALMEAILPHIILPPEIDPIKSIIEATVSNELEVRL